MRFRTSYYADNLGQRMRIAREIANLTTDEVANIMCVSPSSVRQWEGGHKFPSRVNLLAFSGATNSDEEWLKTGHVTDAERIERLETALLKMREIALACCRASDVDTINEIAREAFKGREG